MTGAAELEDVGSGVAPVSDGWFTVNVRDAGVAHERGVWLAVHLRGGMPAMRKRPDLPAQRFAQVGIMLQVLQPGQLSGLYHAESNQEDFLVLAGECLLLVEGEERPLKAWDFFHCPPGTGHVFVGAGEGPYVILMVGARTGDKETVYPESEPARRHGAGAEAETRSAAEAYARFPHWNQERPARLWVLSGAGLVSPRGSSSRGVAAMQKAPQMVPVKGRSALVANEREDVP
jgi:uncharacterized cupin superfamily protein